MKVDLTNNRAVKTINDTLAQLSSERMAWEAGEYARANETLYRLLASCLGVYVKTFQNSTETVQKEIRANIAAHLGGLGIKVQRTSQTINLFVKFVFGSDRKRADKYASVLRAAIADGQTEATFAQWVKDAGGVEEVKRNVVLSDDTLKKREALAEAVQIVAENLTTARIDALGTASFNQPIELGDVNLFIADKTPNGEVRIVGVLPNVAEGLLKRVQQEMGKLEAENIEKAQALGIDTQAVPVASLKLRPRVSAAQSLSVPAATLNEPKLQVNADNNQV